MRLIDADALIAKAYIVQEPNGFIHSVVTERQIVAATTIEAEPVRHGRWNVEYPTGSDFGRCSACKTLGNLDWHYCPNCGAKMESEV